MKIEKVLVTPEIAAKWLANNTQNRKVNQHRVTRYANEMANGRWCEDTGEMIKIAIDNTLIDGQHRLLAVIKSKSNINMHICSEMKNEVFPFIDTNKVRNASDVLSIEGVKNATNKAAFIQSYHQYMVVNSNAMKLSTDNNLTANQVLSFYRQNKDFVDNTIREATNYYNKFQRVLDFGLVSFFTGVLCKFDERLGSSFMRELCEGVDVTNDVIIILRNRLITEKLSTRKSNKSVIRALIIKAWNAYYLGKTLRVIKFNPETEEYPKILGLDK